MNREQIKYARERVEGIYGIKLKDVNKNHQHLPELPNFTSKLALIKSGKAKLISWDKIQEYTDFVRAYTYPQDIDRERIEKQNEVLTRKLRVKLTQERDAILDELLLGDAEKALKLIQKFEAFKV